VRTTFKTSGLWKRERGHLLLEGSSSGHFLATFLILPRLLDAVIWFGMAFGFIQKLVCVAAFTLSQLKQGE